jgi:hypothetical protein
MIDWFGVFHNALWIVGLASVLAALSYADWRRRLAIPPKPLRRALAEPGFQAAASLGLALFCAGLALGSTQAWEIAAWTVLGLVFAWGVWTSLRHVRRRHEPQESPAPADGDKG